MLDAVSLFLSLVLLASLLIQCAGKKKTKEPAQSLVDLKPPKTPASVSIVKAPSVKSSSAQSPMPPKEAKKKEKAGKEGKEDKTRTNEDEDEGEPLDDDVNIVPEEKKKEDDKEEEKSKKDLTFIYIPNLQEQLEEAKKKAAAADGKTKWKEEGTQEVNEDPKAIDKSAKKNPSVKFSNLGFGDGKDPDKFKIPTKASSKPRLRRVTVDGSAPLAGTKKGGSAYSDSMPAKAGTKEKKNPASRKGLKDPSAQGSKGQPRSENSEPAFGFPPVGGAPAQPQKISKDDKSAQKKK